MLNLNAEGEDSQQWFAAEIRTTNSQRNAAAALSQALEATEAGVLNLNAEGEDSQQFELDKHIETEAEEDYTVEVISDQMRLNSITTTIDSSMITVAGRLCNTTLRIRHSTPVQDAWEEIKNGQQNDRIIKAVHDYISRDKDIPAELLVGNLRLEDLSSFHIQDGIVYKVSTRATNGHSLLLWVPPSLQEAYVSRRHQSCLTCHPTADSMKRSMERLYYWPDMTGTIESVVLRCHTCQRVKRPPSKARDKTQFVPISKPNAVVAIDIVGPLGNMKSATSQGNRFICTMVDWFTRFVMCFAIPSTTADVIGDCIAKYTKRFGTPLTIVSDNAKYFTDQALASYEKLMGIKHSFVAAFRPEGNGMLERFHGNLGRSLKVRAADAHSSNWDVELDSISFAYNTTIHGSTGYTPFYLMHGWDPVLPFDISAPPMDHEYQGYHSWVEEAARKQRNAHDEAYRTMTGYQVDRVKKNNPKKPPLKLGDSVYLWVPSIPRQAIKKITMRWHGPYKVTAGRVGRNYTIATKRGRRLIHEQRLRKAWVDDDFAVSTEDDERFEELLDDNGRIDTISGNDRACSEVMVSLLQEEPQGMLVGETRNSCDVDLAYVAIKRCKTIDEARHESREPLIDSSIPPSARPFQDQVDTLAVELTQNVLVTQFGFTCGQCRLARATSHKGLVQDHHSVCLKCWTYACTQDKHLLTIPAHWPEQPVLEVVDQSTDTPDAGTVEEPSTTPLPVVMGTAVCKLGPERFVEDRWYKLAETFDAQQHDVQTKGLAVRSCATCDSQQVIVYQSDIDKYCNQKSPKCVAANCRESTVVWRSNDSYFKKEDGKYEWSDEQAEPPVTAEVWDTVTLEAAQAEDTEYEVLDVRGFEPVGSSYQVYWTNFANKKYGERVHLQYVHGCSQKIASYLETTSGIRRMNNLRKLFHAQANVAMQKSEVIKVWNYKDWTKDIRISDTPHKLIHSVVMISLQESKRASYPTSDRSSHDSFHDQARFTAWVIPTGLCQPSKIGVVVVPLFEISTTTLSKFFNKDPAVGQLTLKRYYESTLDKSVGSPCQVHWVKSIEACERLQIRRDNVGTCNDYMQPSKYFTL